MDKNKSLLDSLTLNEKREIHLDYLHKKDGFDFYYIIDADEIVDFCQPFSKNINKDVGVISDEQFIIDYILNIYKDKAILFEEYFKEIVNLRTFILSSYNKYLNTETYPLYEKAVWDFFNESYKEKAKKDNYFKVAKEYLSLLIAMKDTYKNDFSNFKKIMSFPISFEGKIKDNYISNLLKYYRYDNSKGLKLFSTFHDKRSSKYNDIKAILKTYYLSNKSFKDEKIFYFISSSTTDINILKDNISENKSLNLNLSYYKEYSLIRSKSQLFALLIYELFGNNSNEFFYINFEDFARNLNRIIGKFKEGDIKINDIVDKLKLHNSLNREKIENLTIYYQKFSKLNHDKNRILSSKNIISTLEKSNDNKIKNIPKIVESIMEKMENKLIEEFNRKPDNNSFIDGLKNYVNLTIFENSLVENFAKKIKNNKKYEFDRGDDPSESIFNAFPVLFKYNINVKVLNLFKKAEKEHINKKSFIEFTKDVISKDTPIDDIHINYVYLLLLIKYKYRKDNNSSNFIAYKYVIRLIEKYKIETNNYYENSYLSDLYAIGCWAARRCRKYKLAYILSKEALDIFPLDPRFYHSLALIGFCWKYEFLTKKQYEWSYKKDEYNRIDFYSDSGKNTVIYYCLMAIKYFKFNKDYIENESIKLSYFALLNLTIFCYVVKFKQILAKKNSVIIKNPKTQESIIKSREYLEELKKHFEILTTEDKIVKWEQYPSYLHTEAFLEYYELLNSDYIGISEKDYLKKIKNAKSDIKKAIKKCKKRPSLKKKCKTLLNELKKLEYRKNI